MIISLSSCADKGDQIMSDVILFLFIAFVVITLIMMVVNMIVNILHHNKKGHRHTTSVRDFEERMAIKEMKRGVEVRYLGGYPKWITPATAKLSISNSSILLKKPGEICVISKDDIIEVSNEKSRQRSVGKTVGGAIAGGVLTGGLGFMVGGAIGAKSKNTSELYVTYKYKDRDVTLHLQTGNNTDKIYAWINSLFA